MSKVTYPSLYKTRVVLAPGCVSKQKRNCFSNKTMEIQRCGSPYLVTRWSTIIHPNSQMFSESKVTSLFTSVSHLLYLVCIPSDTPRWPTSHALHTYTPLGLPWQPQKPRGFFQHTVLLCGAQHYTLWVKRHFVFCLVGMHCNETSILSLNHDLLDISMYSHQISPLSSTKDRVPSP